MSPYHDVRMPAGIRYAVTVHDLCLDELASIYPSSIRTYYLKMLRRNLRYAAFVLTVSDTSRDKIAARYGMARDRIPVVRNALPAAFPAVIDKTATASFRERYGDAGKLLLYPGGSEYRKNIGRLAQALMRLTQMETNVTLLVTGAADTRWADALHNIPERVRRRVKFVGTLTDAGLAVAYSAADAVVYPSLCEGFGRVCLEAMSVGTPLACSDFSVMREVAGEYAWYFAPYDVDAIASAIAGALNQGRRSAVTPTQFAAPAVRAAFLQAMDRLIDGDV